MRIALDDPRKLGLPCAVADDGVDLRLRGSDMRTGLDVVKLTKRDELRGL
jgi:hypothetical protein